MDDNLAAKYRKGDRVRARVESILPFGVFVTLPDRSQAYIRKRELSLEGDLDPSIVVHQGEEVEAVVLALAERDQRMELSLRALKPDPWRSTARRLRTNQTVTGAVKQITPRGIMVQIEPGLEGSVSLDELATWRVAHPEELFWLGDLVEARVSFVDLARQSLNLSIRERMKDLSRALEQGSAASSHAPRPSSRFEPVVSEINPLAACDLRAAGPVLVVDDYKPLLSELVAWLGRQACEADSAETAAQAFQRCQEKRYKLVLSGLELEQEDGLDLVARLKGQGYEAAMAIMGTSQWVSDQLGLIQQLQVAAAFLKPLDLAEVLRFLDLLARGESPTFHPDAVAGSVATAAVEGTPYGVRSGEPLSDKLKRLVEKLQVEAKADSCLLFHLDPLSHRVSIVAQAGASALDQSPSRLGPLMYSPVSDVVRDRKPVVQGSLPTERERERFKNLLGLLPFESCVGIPVDANGKLDHVLFMFRDRSEAFTEAHQAQARAAALLVSVALEHEQFDTSVRATGGILLAGELTAALEHEVLNRTSTLELQLRNLLGNLSTLDSANAESNVAKLQEARNGIDAALATTLDLEGTVAEHRRLLETREQAAVDVNKVIRRCARLIGPLARRAHVQIALHLAADLPAARGSSVGLSEVFANLMLNAVQQMATKPDKSRLLEVTTRHRPDDPERTIQVRVADRGPGIHSELWERIFAPGFTTRKEGSGLGLYIARSLLESAQGRIAVEKSYIPLGSTFLVELAEEREHTHVS